MGLIESQVPDKILKVQLYFARMCLTISSDFCLDVFLPLYGARFLEAGVLDVAEPNVVSLFEGVAQRANDRFLP